MTSVVKVQVLSCAPTRADVLWIIYTTEMAGFDSQCDPEKVVGVGANFHGRYLLSQLYRRTDDNWLSVNLLSESSSIGSSPGASTNGRYGGIGRRGRAERHIRFQHLFFELLCAGLLELVRQNRLKIDRSAMAMRVQVPHPAGVRGS